MKGPLLPVDEGEEGFLEVGTIPKPSLYFFLKSDSLIFIVITVLLE